MGWWILCGVWGASAVALLAHLIWLHRHDNRHFRAFRRDMRSVRSVHSQHKCDSCGATATELHVTDEGGHTVYLCKNRELCRQTLIWRNQLDSMG